MEDTPINLLKIQLFSVLSLNIDSLNWMPDDIFRELGFDSNLVNALICKDASAFSLEVLIESLIKLGFNFTSEFGKDKTSTTAILVKLSNK